MQSASSYSKKESETLEQNNGSTDPPAQHHASHVLELRLWGKKVDMVFLGPAA